MVKDTRKKRELLVIVLAVGAAAILQEYLKPTLKRTFKVR